MLFLSMDAAAGTPMPGGWTLSAAWLPLCGQGWGETAACFLGMWCAMTAAMMLPSLAPVLRRTRRAPLVAAGYFGAWAVLGAAVFAVGALLAQALLAWPALARGVPLAGGAAVLVAAALQCSAWKQRHLACCRAGAPCGAPCEERCGEAPAGPARAALRRGLRLGLHCIGSCAGFTLVLLVLGVMDWRAMAAITAAITLERLAPDALRAARAMGALAAGTGVWLLAHAAAAA